MGLPILYLANIISCTVMFVWLVNILMMYLPLLDLIYLFIKQHMHKSCLCKVLADVGYAKDRRSGAHKKRVCDVALAAVV